MSVLQLSTGILDHSSFTNCSRSLTFEGSLLPTAVLRSYVITVCLHARKACSLTTKQSRALDTTVSNRRDSCATLFLTLKIKQKKFTKSVDRCEFDDLKIKNIYIFCFWGG